MQQACQGLNPVFMGRTRAARLEAAQIPRKFVPASKAARYRRLHSRCAPEHVCGTNCADKLCSGHERTVQTSGRRTPLRTKEPRCFLLQRRMHTVRCAHARLALHDPCRTESGAAHGARPDHAAGVEVVHWRTDETRQGWTSSSTTGRSVLDDCTRRLHSTTALDGGARAGAPQRTRRRCPNPIARSGLQRLRGRMRRLPDESAAR